MRLVFIGRDQSDLNGMGQYLPAEDTTVFLTRAAKPSVVSPAAGNAPSSEALEDSCEALTGTGNSPSSCNTREKSPQLTPVGKSQARPWLFAFVGVLSLCLTQISYHYIRGKASVYVDYEKGCGEWCFEGQPSQTQYFLTKAFVIATSYVAIASTCIFARWASNFVAALKCPFVVETRSERTQTKSSKCLKCCNPATVSTTVAQQRPSPHQQLDKGLSPNISVKYGRPCMVELIDAALLEVEASDDQSEGSLTRGLFVCVCGPGALVQSCKDATRDAKRRHQGIAIGMHAEEPDW
jgi:hypothetical protein